LTHIRHVPQSARSLSARGNRRSTLGSVHIATENLPLPEHIVSTIADYAKKYFRVQKIQNEFSVQLGSLLSYSEEPLQDSILKMEEEDNKIAQEISALFIKYLTSSPKDVRFVAEALSKASTKSVLVNESYFQAIKHTIGTQHKSTEELKVCWEWFTMLTLAYSPVAPEINAIIESYLETKTNSKEDASIQKLTNHALKQITKRKQVGPRSTLPSLREYIAVRDGMLDQSLPVKVIDNNMIFVIDSCTSVLNASLAIATETLKVPADNFGLMLLMDKGFDVPINSGSILADLIADKEAMSLTSKTVPLRFSLSVQVWNFRLTKNTDDKLLDVLYAIMRNRILNYDISCSCNKVIDLAAFMLHASSLDQPTKQNLGLFIPRHLIGKAACDTLPQKITETAMSMQLHSMQKRDIKLAFLQNAATKFVWSWTFFPLKSKKILRGNFVRKYMGISTRGIALFVRREGEPLTPSDVWDWDHIESYSLSSDKNVVIRKSGGSSKSFAIMPFCMSAFQNIYTKYQQSRI